MTDLNNRETQEKIENILLDCGFALKASPSRVTWQQDRRTGQVTGFHTSADPELRLVEEKSPRYHIFFITRKGEMRPHLPGYGTWQEALRAYAGELGRIRAQEIFDKIHTVS